MATIYKLLGTHKAQGWTRELIIADGWGSGQWRVVPTDGSGTRVVAVLSRGSWANNPKDDKANIGRDRVLLMEGEPLPEWATAWLEKAWAKSCESGRASLQAAMDDADWNESRNEGW
jgi:hypothetical protein